MKLDNLYSLRNKFTIIGITGRTGSGCTMVSHILSKNFSEIESKGFRNSNVLDDNVFKRKYEIVKSFLSYQENWQPFEIIKYKDVLLFYILNKYGGDDTNIFTLLSNFYRESKADNNRIAVTEVLKGIKKLDIKYSQLINDIKQIDFSNIKSSGDLENLNELFFGKDFQSLSINIFKLLEDHGYYRRTKLLHIVAYNIRSNGDPLDENTMNFNSIFSIANLINKLIKARKNYNGPSKATRIVIDSLRNSLEIMFFKERYSAFYMLATKDVLSNAQRRVSYRLRNKIKDEAERKLLVEKLFKLDQIEYETNDFSKGMFSSPDVENCIQKSDYHIFNLPKSKINKFADSTKVNKNNFLTREEQLGKFISLILQPGLITPSSSERIMQIANTSKLNSGCISRKVGAVITDPNYYVLATGWNDVASGNTPCNVRDFEDYLGNILINPNYSNFEKGIVSDISTYNYKKENLGNFKEAIIDYYKEDYSKNKNDLIGKNCAFCFKTIHNHYEGEKNQVHTRSLHAEENAMLQITKLGGQGVINGILFTTASPCELCSKKAYQLGIRKIYYIDPYPGISNDQILQSGTIKTRPKMIPFSGAIGTVYHKLYEPFLSYKDEISMTLELKPKNKLGIQFKNILKGIKDERVKSFLDREDIKDDDIKALIIKGLENSESP